MSSNNKLLSRINFGGRIYKIEDADLDNIEAYESHSADKGGDEAETSLQVDDDTRARRQSKFGGVDDTEMRDSKDEPEEHKEQENTENHNNTTNATTHDTVNIDDAVVRPYSLFLVGDIVGKLSTQQLLAYASEFCDPPPYGMEWIDDQRCVFLWHESHDFRQAWRGLLLDPPEGGMARHGQPHFFDLHAARNVPSTLSKVDPTTSDADADAVQIRVRPATTADVKQKTQYRNSRWYSNHGRRAGKIGDEPVRARSDSTRDHPREVSPGRWQNDKADLDAELDGISKGDYRDYSPPRGGRRGRNKYGRDRRDRDRDGDTRKHISNADDLDKELDEYLSKR
ncbi:hypothetical protein E3P99_02168 [Wallemia hederae]|uniref:Chromatin target of PRMT1 protein C-terminal domain-containing protein n=1 Tax=Wallemia hederae TaxID=1540922 RepID=A0A4T0FN88_9BASI|nr:hypothetical protein E3P99_02168 [Wallemia hederae]